MVSGSGVGSASDAWGRKDAYSLSHIGNREGCEHLASSNSTPENVNKKTLMYMCVHVYVCMCACVRACVCVYVCERET